MKKIIFVGVHNKPGKAPLCNTTRTGKAIQAIEDLVTIHTLEPRPVFLRTNLHDCNYVQDITPGTAVNLWVTRVKPDPSDLVVCLGELVAYPFRITAYPNYIHIKHPGSFFRGETSFVMSEYIKQSADTIIKHICLKK